MIKNKAEIYFELGNIRFFRLRRANLWPALFSIYNGTISEIAQSYNVIQLSSYAFRGSGTVIECCYQYHCTRFHKTQNKSNKYRYGTDRLPIYDYLELVCHSISFGKSFLNQKQT